MWEVNNGSILRSILRSILIKQVLNSVKLVRNLIEQVLNSVKLVRNS